jgi:nucleoside-diphosphate-sugar epimerase
VRVLIIGCGYIGQPLATVLCATHEVCTASRSAEKVSKNIEAIACDITEAMSVERLPREFDVVINTVSSSKGGTGQYRSVYLEGTRRLLAHLRFQKYIWTSSTSVYAQTDGSVVTEESPAEPSSPTSRILRETEELVLKGQGIVLRLAGIYGPDRGHLFQQYLRGEARIHGNGARWLNMVHQDDAVGAIIAALENARAGEIYNVADNEPVTERAFFAWLAEQLKRDAPPTAAESELAGRKRGVTSKRVSNRKLREELRYQFTYPTFREGYESELIRLGLQRASK